jgi:NAD(P)-dependent dehydrogenase (short-subunit alcohol dehydrogenase family)
VLLTGKNAIIYGGAGAIGSAVAAAFAAEGAKVHLAGRTLQSLEAVANTIRAAGGLAETAEVDALDEYAVDQHAAAVAASSGGIDISFNLISHPQTFGTPLVEMNLADFELPVLSSVRTMFLTSRAAARYMIQQRSGVILTFGGYGDPSPNLGGFQAGFGAVEALRRSLAAELGVHGIRVLTLQTAGIPESMPDTFDAKAREALANDIAGRTMLKRAATLADVGALAAFAASDRAAALTGTALNLTAGAVVN